MKSPINTAQANLVEVNEAGITIPNIMSRAANANQEIVGALKFLAEDNNVDRNELLETLGFAASTNSGIVEGLREFRQAELV